MRQYIYGEVFLKTNKHLYLIKVNDFCMSGKVYADVYVKCSGYGVLEHKTLSNTYTSADGNVHITELRENKYINYNKVNKENWKKAILKRIQVIK
jgi:hypothetical protein